MAARRPAEDHVVAGALTHGPQIASVRGRRHDRSTEELNLRSLVEVVQDRAVLRVELPEDLVAPGQIP